MANWKVRDAKSLNDKVAALLAGVEYRGGYSFSVPSNSGKGPYAVSLNPTLDGGRCTCEWFQYASRQEKVAGDVICAHILAAIKWCAAENGQKARAYASAEAAKRQKRTILGNGQGVYIVLRRGV